MIMYEWFEKIPVSPVLQTAIGIVAIILLTVLAAVCVAP